MTRSHSAARVLLSPVLLDTITAYQAGCCEDMQALASVLGPLKAMTEVCHPYLWWTKDAYLAMGSFASFHQVVTAWYNEVGHSRLTKLFACMPQIRDVIAIQAVYSGNESVLAQLPVDVVQAVEIPLMDLAALKGHLGVLKHLHAEVGYDGCTTWAVDCAAVHGHLDVVAYLLANRREGCSQRAFKRAADEGHLSLVKLFLAHTPLSWLPVALGAAAGHNHFAIVSYILDHWPAVTSTTNAMHQAARNGHLEMVQFLHERNFECTTSAMDGAAGGGHLDVVKWLHENRTEGCTHNAMDDAALFGHVEVVEWLHEHRQEGCTVSALLNAVHVEQWDIVLVVAWHCAVGDVEMVLEHALESGASPDVEEKLKSIIKSKQ